MTPTERMAPGHVYQPTLGTGIEWLPGVARLWEQGQVTLEAPHATESREAFFYSLAFREAFPQITHWWFRSAWTGTVQLTRPDPALSQNSAIGGWVTFGTTPELRQPWHVTNTQMPIVATPYPPMHEQPVNLPLRIVLARMVIGLLNDDLLPNHDYLVTSLVHRDALGAELPTTHEDWQRTYGNWCIANGAKALTTPIRQALVELQGLEAPIAA